jgi:hypothetical protein
MVFENGVKNIQAVAYNGARTVVESKNQLRFLILISKTSLILQDFQNKSTRCQKFLYHITNTITFFTKFRQNLIALKVMA